MENRRGKFPRLYFLSNEELIEIFGRGHELVDSMARGEQKGFLSNIFDGVDKLIFDQASMKIIAMRSKEGE